MRKNSLSPQGHAHKIAGRTIPLRIVEHQRATRLTLRIEAGGKAIRVTVPPGLAQGEIDRFVNKHQSWLEARICKFPDRDELVPGMKIPLRGVPHEIVHKTGRGLTRVTRTAANLPIIEVFGGEAHIGRRIADLLKQEARAEITRLVSRHSAAIGRRAQRITLRDTTSRWGSCSANGNLSFSWRIIMAPRSVIDYLVAHEVAHLQEMNHGPAFWKLCTRLCPKTSECKAWLKRNGGKLQAIPF